MGRFVVVVAGIAVAGVVVLVAVVVAAAVVVGLSFCPAFDSNFVGSPCFELSCALGCFYGCTESVHMYKTERLYAMFVAKPQRHAFCWVFLGMLHRKVSWSFLLNRSPVRPAASDCPKQCTSGSTCRIRSGRKQSPNKIYKRLGMLGSRYD